MDMSEDLCRADFFDLVPMGLDQKFDPSSGLMPVALIDSSDYMQQDGNNNNLNGTTGHIKSFLDEMFLNESLNGGDPSHLGNQFEVLGTFQWSGDGTTSTTTSTSTNGEDSPPGDPSTWLLHHPGYNNDGEVTTLTNLIDPLFVTYEDENGGSVTTKIENYLGDSRGVVSSDLISSTFLNEAPGDSPTDVSQSSSESELISWQKTEGLGNSLYCDDSLLRSALQSGNNNNNNNNSSNSNNSASNNNSGSGTTTTTKIVKLTTILASPSSTSTGTGEMTELRKVLSFPPLTNSDIQSQSSTSLSSEVQPYYELKVIDPVFASHDDNIPNVEELIMTRIDPSFSVYQQHQQQGKDDKKKLGEISERKINSTTLSTKWTYTTNDQGKPPRKRAKKNNGNQNFGPKKPNQIISDNNNNGLLTGPYSPTNKGNGSPTTSQQQSNGNNANNGNGIRKERSLHYCNICSKGFKDKYSVNVHVRTHTGEKPFLCSLCSKAFRQKAHLAKHYQTHSAKAANNQNKPNSKR